MNIGNIKLNNNLILAPMAGVTDVGFRAVCVQNGADYGVTEMISAKAILYNNKKTISLLNTTDNEQIKVVQLFGHEADVFEKVCKSEHLKKFDIIDLNMGCPAPKIVNNGDGAALMKNLELAENIIKTCVRSSNKLITVKFRSGYDINSINAVEFAKMCERAGASAITIHGRTRDQFYAGNVDLNIIKKVKEAVKIPVIGNGDVKDFLSFVEMKKYTNCDAVMIGRASLGNENIFCELLNKKPIYNTFESIKKHIEILKQFYPDNYIVRYMRKHLLWYLKGSGLKQLKIDIVKIENLNEILRILKNCMGEL